jgi:hypothetical protein
MKTMISLQMEPHLEKRCDDLLATHLAAGFKTRQISCSHWPMSLHKRDRQMVVVARQALQRAGRCSWDLGLGCASLCVTCREQG